MRPANAGAVEGANRRFATVTANRVSLKPKTRQDVEFFLFNSKLIDIETIRNGVSGSYKAEQWRRLCKKAEPGG